MPNTTLSPNMNLTIPISGIDPGPQYALDVNSCLTVVDSHNHTPGSGVQVPTAGLDINADLPFGDNNATVVRSVRFNPHLTPLALPADLGCLYESGVDLYYNDGSGNQIQITSGGGVAGSPGSITGLVPPASASYVSGSSTFVWQSDVLTPANMDFASATFRNLSASSKGLTLSPPAAMAADYAITLPALPVSVEKFVSMDTGGNMFAHWSIDNVTLQNVANVISVNPTGLASGIAAAIADGVSTVASGSTLGVRNTMFTHSFELNGNYGNLTIPTLQIDGLRFFNFNATIVNAWAWIRGAGSSGTTAVDIKYASAPGGSFASIFSTTPKFASTAGASAYTDSAGVVTPGTGVTAGVLSTTSVAAGGALKMDLTGTMVNPDSVGVTIIFKQR